MMELVLKKLQQLLELQKVVFIIIFLVKKKYIISFWKREQNY